MATAPPSVSTAWIPEDDVLLKNAVEDGASLEALAKGAVPFSRRFTFQELQDRWHSLLYDPDISVQASACMFELELSGFNPSFKSAQSKVYKEFPEKRKFGSFCKQYYSMRKKFRSEFFNPSGLSFLDEHSLHDCSGHGADFQPFNGDPQDRNCMLGNCIQDHFEFQEADIEILRSAFPKTRDTSVTSGAISAHTSYLAACSNTIEDKHPHVILRKDGYAEDLSTSLRQHSIQSNSNFIQGSSVNFDGRPGIQEHELQQVPSNRKLFESLEMQQMPAFDSIKDSQQNVFHGLQQGEHLNSPNSNSSFHTIGFPSPQPNLPLWEPAEDFSAAALPASLKQEDTAQDAGRMLPDDGGCKEKDTLVYNAVHPGPMLGTRHNGTRINNSSTVSEGEDISDSLLNLSNEDEILLIDVEGKDTSEKSSSDNLNPLLLTSPNDVPDGISNPEPERLLVSETCLVDPNNVNIEMSRSTTPIHMDDQNVHHLDVKVPSTSILIPDTHGLNDGNVCCSLNTEDPEIPCNDDIFLLIHPSTSFASSAAQQPITRNSMDQSSAANQNQSGQGLNLTIKGKDLSGSSNWSQKIGPNVLPEAHPAHSPFGFGVKSELPDINSLSSLPGDVKKVFADACQNQSLRANHSKSAARVLDEDVTRVDLKAGETSAALVESQNLEAGSIKTALSESLVNPSTSEQAESQSDNDVPYFSDIEAMILEMDLEPYDLDSNSTKQVSRYQYEDSKRTIIRLEQCAQSCLQRVMTSRGALAVFYGRHLRHYISKTEVILGRSTEDVDVDIDLRKEGRANKISRRQAIIKMEGDGSFSLKNLGKILISVNGKSVPTGQLLSLSSSCFIEIGGMSFVFEVNKKYVGRYISTISQKSKEENSKFEWSPELDV